MEYIFNTLFQLFIFYKYKFLTTIYNATKLDSIQYLENNDCIVVSAHLKTYTQIPSEQLQIPHVQFSRKKNKL